MLLARKQVSAKDRLASGLAGALALTAVNELGHRIASESPRLDVLGMRAVVRGMRATGHQPPDGRVVPLTALAGDLLTNALFYAAAVGGRKQHAARRAGLVGLAGGVAAALIGRRMGMNRRTGYHWGRELTMVAFYAGAGLVAAAALRAIA